MSNPSRLTLLLATVFAFVCAPGNFAHAQTAPQLQSAAARKAHGTANHDLGLPLAGNSGIEPRNLSAGLTVVFNFDKPVTAATAAVTAGAATIQGTTASNNQVLVALANVGNAQSVRVALSNVTPAGGGTAGSAAVTFRTLEGDVNGSGSVTVADVNLAKYYVGQAISGFNARNDVNATNSVTVSDINLVKFRVGTFVGGGAAANTAPSVSNIADQSTTTATAKAVSFTVGDAETPDYALSVRATSGNLALLPDSGIAFSGTGASRTLTLTPAANQTGTATVTVSVSDGTMVATDQFVLTVTASQPQPPPTGNATLFVTTLRPEGTAQSAGSGSSTIQLSADQTYAIVRVEYSNLTTTKTGMHIHGPADPGTAGAIIFDLDTTPTQQDGSWRWTFVQSGNTSVADQVAALKSGRLYVNVHSSKYPGGELRGHYLAASGSQTFTPPPAPPALPGGQPTQKDAVRFLAQATYGGNEDLINQVVQQGYDAWITNQFNTPQTSQAAILQARAASEAVTFNQYWDSWWKLANTAPDQLRQRTAFALSQIFVVNQSKSLLGQWPIGMGMYYDMLGRNGFGNFRQLLEDVTVSPVMGEFLDLRGSRKADPSRGLNPNENYAREILQLFSIGVYQLHPDGTLKLGSNGQPIPTYDQDTVIGFARAFTGWDYGPGGPEVPPPNYHVPMAPVPGAAHETGTKKLLNGVTISAGGNAQSDLKAAIDNIFNHPNCGPFVSKQLIQKLVCSNPSPGYVYRVAQKFDNNGSGVRGDMKAVIRAILTDYEARSNDMLAQQGFGKLREPLLRTTAVMRALHAYSFYAPYHWSIDNTDEHLGQTPMNAPTVFNFFEPGYVHPGILAQNGLVAPEFQITNETTTMTVANWFVWGIGYGFKYGDIKLKLDPEVAIAGNATALVDRLNLLLCAGQLSDAAKAVIVNHLNTIPAGDPLGRARAAVYLISSSAQFAVQR
jgi:uncharacterized protein (DUF1800 family)